MLYLRKSSGERQRFDLQKFRRSLLKAGASEKNIQSIIRQIKKDKPRSTRRVHEITTQILQKQNPAVADRYNLKRGLMELGPDGYPFELFVAQLFQALGYETKTGRILPGVCVDHEIDVVARKANHHAIIECKFHNKRGAKSDVKVTLYVQARFEDIAERWEQTESNKDEVHQVWVVTNTKFTSEAIKYATCREIKLLGWGYPARNSLAHLIEKHKLFPITTLTSLSSHQKKQFLKNGFVLCKDAKKHESTLKKLGFKPNQIKAIIKEAGQVCKV